MKLSLYLTGDINLIKPALPREIPDRLVWMYIHASIVTLCFRAGVKAHDKTAPSSDSDLGADWLGYNWSELLTRSEQFCTGMKVRVHPEFAKFVYKHHSYKIPEEMLCSSGS